MRIGLHRDIDFAIQQSIDNTTDFIEGAKDLRAVVQNIEAGLSRFDFVDEDKVDFVLRTFQYGLNSNQQNLSEVLDEKLAKYIIQTGTQLTGQEFKTVDDFIIGQDRTSKTVVQQNILEMFGLEFEDLPYNFISSSNEINHEFMKRLFNIMTANAISSDKKARGLAKTKAGRNQSRYWWQIMYVICLVS